MRLLVLVRVFAVVVGLQVSGIGPAAAEVLRGVTCESIDTRESARRISLATTARPAALTAAAQARCFRWCRKSASRRLALSFGVRQPREQVARRAPNVPELAGLFRPPCNRAVS